MCLGLHGWFFIWSPAIEPWAALLASHSSTYSLQLNKGVQTSKSDRFFNCVSFFSKIPYFRSAEKKGCFKNLK